MRLGLLIQRAERARAAHGDMDIFVRITDKDGNDVDEIDVKDTETFQSVNGERKWFFYLCNNEVI